MPEQTRIDGLHDPPGMSTLLEASSASAVVRIVIVGFLIALTSRAAGELTASIRNYAVGAATSAEPFEQVVADPDGVGHRGEGRVDRADARVKAGVDHVEVVDFVGPAVGVEHRGMLFNAPSRSAGPHRDMSFTRS